MNNVSSTQPQGTNLSVERGNLNRESKRSLAGSVGNIHGLVNEQGNNKLAIRINLITTAFIFEIVLIFNFY